MTAAYDHKANPSMLDKLYGNHPPLPNKFIWPVFDDPIYATKPIAWFDTEGEAIDFVHAALGRINLYLGEPVYRDAADVKVLGNGWHRHAA